MPPYSKLPRDLERPRHRFLDSWDTDRCLDLERFRDTDRFGDTDARPVGGNVPCDWSDLLSWFGCFLCLARSGESGRVLLDISRSGDFLSTLTSGESGRFLGTSRSGERCGGEGGRMAGGDRVRGLDGVGSRWSLRVSDASFC